MKILDNIFKGLRFRADLRQFRLQSHWPIEIEPKLDDFGRNAGCLGEYFWQDLWVAKMVLALKPDRHFDIGSRLDGFVANVACHRPIEVFDRRPLPFPIPGVTFHQLDISLIPDSFHGKADCVTCLHSIEHFGLGRYGDELADLGWQEGFNSLCKMVCPHGRLILSAPIGIQRVKFNAHRIFHPTTLADYAKKIGLEMESFTYLRKEEDGSWLTTCSHDFEKDYQVLGKQKYSLGIFTMTKYPVTNE